MTNAVLMQSLHFDDVFQSDTTQNTPKWVLKYSKMGIKILQNTNTQVFHLKSDCDL